jgi:hypothetical protein
MSWDPFERLRPKREAEQPRRELTVEEIEAKIASGWAGKADAGEGRHEPRPVPLSFSEQMQREYEAARTRRGR